MTTTTTTPDALFTDATEFDPMAHLPVIDDGFDPTRVRLTGLRPADWSEEAACFRKAARGDDPWHPGPEGVTGEFSPRARQTCGGCPLRAQCLALGLATLPLGNVWGMYGGYTPTELRAIAKARSLPTGVVAQHGTRARRVAGCACDDCRRAHAEWTAQRRAEEAWAESDAAPTVTGEATVTVLPERFADLFDELAGQAS